MGQSVAMGLLPDRSEFRLPAWVLVVCLVVGAMAGFLLAVIDSVFAGGTGTRFAVVFLVGGAIGFVMFWLWALEIKSISRGRSRLRQKLQDRIRNAGDDLHE